MALTHLVDTSVISRLGAPTVRDVIEPLVLAGQAGRAGITDIEVGSGSRNEREWDDAMEDLSVFGLVETTAQHLRRARQVQRLLTARSQRGRKVPDLLIAAAAEEAGLILLHYDGDFDRIAAVTSQRCQWVVAAGSVG
jgi:predicted nucleic acid-binding protein